MKRRQAIRLLGGAAGASLATPEGTIAELIAWGSRVRLDMNQGGSPARQVVGLLTPARSIVMEALAEVIIPETDTPGAREADVSGFVDALVDGWLDEDDRDRFLEGLDGVDPTARELFGSDFAACSEEQRQALVGEWDAELSALRADPDQDASLHFFHDVKRFAITAYFTSAAGLAATGHRFYHPRFEGCAPLAGEACP